MGWSFGGDWIGQPVERYGVMAAELIRAIDQRMTLLFGEEAIDLLGLKTWTADDFAQVPLEAWLLPTIAYLRGVIRDCILWRRTYIPPWVVADAYNIDCASGRPSLETYLKPRDVVLNAGMGRFLLELPNTYEGMRFELATPYFEQMRRILAQLKYYRFPLFIDGWRDFPGAQNSLVYYPGQSRSTPVSYPIWDGTTWPRFGYSEALYRDGNLVTLHGQCEVFEPYAQRVKLVKDGNWLEGNYQARGIYKPFSCGAEWRGDPQDPQAYWILRAWVDEFSVTITQAPPGVFGTNLFMEYQNYSAVPSITFGRKRPSSPCPGVLPSPISNSWWPNDPQTHHRGISGSPRHRDPLHRRPPRRGRR